MKKKYIYGPAIDEPVMMIDMPTGNKFYYHYNALGSVIALSDSSGYLVEKYTYQAFGATQIWSPTNDPRTTSAYGNRFMFTAREYDAETGLYYYRARYYSPSIGRFLQPDPIGYAAGVDGRVCIG